MADGEQTCMTPVVIQIVGQNATISAGVDDVSASLQAIDMTHQKIHKGVSFVSTFEATLSTDGTISLSFRTPDTTQWAHLTFFGRASGEANIMLIENPTITLETGTLQPAFNRNRNSANVTTLSDSSTAAWTPGNITLDATQSGGTVIYEEHFGAGQTRGGATTGREEFMLKPNEEYVILLTSEANTNDCEIILDWYEHASLA